MEVGLMSTGTHQDTLAQSGESTGGTAGTTFGQPVRPAFPEHPNVQIARRWRILPQLHLFQPQATAARLVLPSRLTGRGPAARTQAGLVTFRGN